MPTMKRWVLCAVVAACGRGHQDFSEVCTGELDEDGDGLVDCGDDDCDDDPACQAPPVELCDNDLDDDVDGHTDCDDDECWDNAACFTHDDPADLAAPDGDPSLDIDKVHVDLTGNVATFISTFEGPWPAPTGTYSWFIRFEIDNDGFTPIAAATIQQHMGTDSTIPQGIPAGNVTVRQSPVGIWVRITGVPSGGVNFYVESGIQKTAAGTRVTDVLGSTPQPLP